MKKPKFAQIAHLAPKNAKFVWIGFKIAIFAWLSVIISTQTNHVITNSPSIPCQHWYLLHPINAGTLPETGYFLPHQFILSHSILGGEGYLEC